jgi:Fur family transcriptional regulator, ferric uptake regulator
MSRTRHEAISLPPRARLTRQRRAVLEAIRGGPRTFTATELYDRARKREPALGLATVYRTIELLRRSEAIRPLAGSVRAEYVRCTPGHHHHLICLSCGSVEETDLCAAPPAAELRRRHGFTPASHELDVFGTCAECRAA